MGENLGNLATSTLHTSVVAGTTTWVVDNPTSGPVYPSPSFRVRLGTAATGEIVLVTAAADNGNGTSNWTVSRAQESTTAQSWSAGATITHVLTATGLSNFVAQNSTSIAVVQSSHGFSVGNAVYYTGSAWAKAIANASTSLGLGIVSAVADANNCTIQFNGPITGLSGLTSGQYYFVSDSSAGALTTTEPTASGSYSNPILFATSTTTGVVLPFRPKTVVGVGSLPSAGRFTYLLDGSAPFANIGSGGAANLSLPGVAGTGYSTGDGGLWKSTRTALRTFTGGWTVNPSAVDWRNTSFTMEAFCSVLDVPSAPGSILSLVNWTAPIDTCELSLWSSNDSPVGAAAGAGLVYLLRWFSRGGVSPGSSGYVILDDHAANLRSMGIGGRHHYAIVFDRSNAAAVTMTFYLDGMLVTQQNLGGFVSFGNNPNSFYSGFAGTTGWINLTNSALTAAQIRANTMLLHSA